MKLYQKMQLAGAIYETILAIPIVGAMIIMGWYWIPLLVAVIYHSVTLVYTMKEGGNKVGPILGIITGVIGVVPLLGWSMHVVTAIFLYLGALKPEEGVVNAPLDQTKDKEIEAEVEVTEIVSSSDLEVKPANEVATTEQVFSEVSSNSQDPLPVTTIESSSISVKVEDKGGSADKKV
jgi:hypothetical protein